MGFAGSKEYGTFSNSELVDYVRQEWGPGRKALFRDPNKGDWS